MTDEERARILKEAFFYHITLLGNLASIKAKGLDPAHSDPSKYLLCQKPPAVFLCTNAGLDLAKRMFTDGLDGRPRVVLKVPATAVAQHECEVDYSFPDLTKGLNFLQCLEEPGFIACYGTIPGQLLKVVGHQDDQGHWLNGE